MDINNKVAIVISGGLAYISFATVQHLLRNGAKHVAIFDKKFEDYETKKNLTALEREFPKNSFECYVCDVANSARYEDCYARVVNYAGNVDILIYNAGLAYNGSVACENIDDEMHYNFNIPIHCVLLALNRMSITQLGKGGVIIIICSALGLILTERQALYSSTKHGNLVLARASKDNKSLNGVRILCIIPHGTTIPTERVVADKLQGTTVTGFLNKGYLRTMFERYTFEQTPQDVAAGIIEVIKSDDDEEVWVCQNGRKPFAFNEKDKIEKLLEYCDPALGTEAT